MPDSEARRLDLYNRLQEVLGTDPTTTLMSHMATTSEMTDRFDRIEEGLKDVNRKIDRVLLTVVRGIFAILAAIIGRGAFA